MSTFSSRKNSGSPPRMRGKVLCGRSSAGRHGITPAYAGKSTKQAKQQDKARDHPRVCGEKPLQSSVNCTMEGLPPRMRGKVISSLQCDFLSGITPAYAGKSAGSGHGGLCFWDHPRVCGEKMVSMIPHRRSRGSPPRVRGKVQPLGERGSQAGITPACAGKRRSIGRLSQPTRDHPRVCGEKSMYDYGNNTAQGSPPRMRRKGPRRRGGQLVMVRTTMAPHPLPGQSN